MLSTSHLDYKSIQSTGEEFGMASEIHYIFVQNYYMVTNYLKSNTVLYSLPSKQLFTNPHPNTPILNLEILGLEHLLIMLPLPITTLRNLHTSILTNIRPIQSIGIRRLQNSKLSIIQIIIEFQWPRTRR